MSTIERRNSIDSRELLSTTASTPRATDNRGSTRVYDELGRLAEFMPDRYREVFCFRWGLRGQFAHLTSQTARKFEIPRSTVDQMLNRCLWNISRHSHTHKLPAIRELLGDDPSRWPERAWAALRRRPAHLRRTQLRPGETPGALTSERRRRPARVGLRSRSRPGRATIAARQSLASSPATRRPSSYRYPASPTASPRWRTAGWR